MPQRPDHLRARQRLRRRSRHNRSLRTACEHPPRGQRLSDELDRWQSADGDKTLGSLIETFEEKSFAVLFVVLLAVPALPLPTGGATHVFELIAMLLALQLIVGRGEVWLPRRWREMKLVGDKRQRFIERLIKMIRRLERFSRPRAGFLFGHRLSNVVFGALVLAGTVTAFVAPPFSGLDTLPALGVVVLSIGVLLEDVIVAAAGLLIGAGGIVLVVALGRAALRSIDQLATLSAAAVPGCRTRGRSLIRQAARVSSRRCTRPKSAPARSRSGSSASG